MSLFLEIMPLIIYLRLLPQRKRLDIFPSDVPYTFLIIILGNNELINSLLFDHYATSTIETLWSEQRCKGNSSQ